MKIDNLCKSVPVECGVCKSESSLIRYLQLEGWVPGTYLCPKCGFRRDLLADPQLLKKRGKITHLEKTQCQKCDHEGLIFKQRARL